MEEAWNPIKGFEGLYEISNMGRVKSLGRDIIRKDGTRKVFSPKILKSYSGNSINHQKVDLRTIDNKRRVKFVHRLVAESFIPNPENKPFIDHIDTNPLNNRVDNLRWVTASENSNNPLSVKKSKYASDKHGLILRNKIKEAFDKGLKAPVRKGMNRPRPVVAMDERGNAVNKYPSAAEAARAFNLHNDAIARVCRGDRINSKPGGYSWKYIDKLQEKGD